MIKSKQKKSLQSVLIKPAGPDCNLRCGYCFYIEKAQLFPESKTHRMSLETLEELIRQVMRQGPTQLSFGWQGGEPTLMGLDFFRKAVEFQQKYGRGQSVGNGLQTNGLLIDDQWARFLKSYHFLVGLSIDGPEEIHNHYRVNKSQKGSWQRVRDTARLLLDAGVNVNALTVISDFAARFPEEIYQFHKDLGLAYMQFIPCLEPDPANPARPAPFSLGAEPYGRFLCTLFDLWCSDFKNSRPTTSVRYFDSLFHRYVGLPAPECTLQPECGDYVVIEHNGDVYSCDFFVDPQWRLGNIGEGRLVDMLNSRRQNRFGGRKAILPKPCHQCPWRPFCHGGCPKNRIQNSLNQLENYYCKSYKQFFQHADRRLRDMAQNWKQEQQRRGTPPTDTSQPSAKAKIGRNQPCPCGSGKKYKRCCGNAVRKPGKRLR
jgi:serine-type anaerobic sulfatase-maturating enzyme